ncbi:hypothetical protein LO772_31810 [Yinghuangia sp. ASG 101]|uniref:hypothetical protein n=1 Tax=Yinghuangia sp. ASG 101 TaxID=2896848 RepID=UPI001E4DA9DB|nr:hypothetical protein [Yinghuangia sp. ASG 101]UGQ11333.1 hypothetical protein LO772_31810 [Yinghuangia sp. ASG 101]
MHQTRLCAFLDHGCPGAGDKDRWWDDAPIAAAAHAYLLSCWIAEDAPRGSTVPGLYAAGGWHGRSNQGREDYVNLATAYEAGLYPHIDVPSGTTRQALGCRPLDEEELRKSVTDAVLRPWRDHGAEASPRVTGLLDALLTLLTQWRSEFHVVEAVRSTDGLPVPGELHILSATSYDVVRLSLLASAPEPVRRGGLLPHPGCSFGGHGCSDGHVLTDDEADRVHTALRAMSAGTVLSMNMPVNNNTHISFTVKLTSHDPAAAQTAAAWIDGTRWGEEFADWDAELNTVFAEDTWRAELAGFRSECREAYGAFSDAADGVESEALADALLRDMLDAPVHRIASDAADGESPVHVAASLGEYGWFDAEQDVFVVVVGPKEAMLLRIDGVA